MHLNVPSPSPLRDAPPREGAPAVLVEHRGATPPVSAESIQRLVAGESRAWLRPTWWS